MSEGAPSKLPWGLRTETLAPGSLKTITETKIKAFEQGAMNMVKVPLSRKEIDEMKRKQQAEETAEVYRDFVASFEDTNKVGKMFVKGATIQAGVKTTETTVPDKGRLYKPVSKLQELAKTFTSYREKDDSAESTSSKAAKPKKVVEKKKTNLETFKEELKRIQEERDRRHALKRKLKEQEESGRKSRFEPYVPPDIPIESELSLDDTTGEKYASDDPNSTNIFLSNLTRSLSEVEIIELFGQYGPLASVKIMYPRSEEERARGSNCGFVAFMARKDAEKALAELDGYELGGLRLRLSWGKTVHIPMQPVYIPPALLELTLPPPPSGYPFNAQPPLGCPRFPISQKPNYDQIKQIIENSVVKVVVPTDRALLCLIHRTIEFVIREGPMFEAMIMNKEMNNSQFRFLFENQSPAHIYYRWKLFSLLQGDSVSNWRTENFKMFKDGSIWMPPPINQYTQGVQDAAYEKARLEFENRKGRLTDSQREKFEEMLRNLTTDRNRIADTMCYCIDHAESAEEIVECISESLSIAQTPFYKKIARLFLISDVLHNCSVKVSNASYYRRGFETRLPDIFKEMHEVYKRIDSKIKAEQFKFKVMMCFRAWEDWAVYPSDYLIRLQNIFLGLVKFKACHDGTKEYETVETAIHDDDIDGKPLISSYQEDADIDGKPLEDIDGKPLETLSHSDNSDIDGKPLNESSPSKTDRGQFIRSKWETLDPDEVASQVHLAITTSKWDIFDQYSDSTSCVSNSPCSKRNDSTLSAESCTSSQSDAEQSHRVELSDKMRNKLREIEMKVMKFQDELETGKRSVSSSNSISEEVQKYREKLLNKEKSREETESKERDLLKRKKEGEHRVREWEKAREKEREREKQSRLKKKRSKSSSDSNDTTSRSRSRRRHQGNSNSRELSPKRSRKQKRKR